ncbi:MAG: hypothetical protein ACM357_11085 [Gemmatimonadota bacterium]
MPSFRRALVTAALLGLGAGCSGGPAGPDENVLVGQFGASDLTMELLATHAGLDIALGCGDYFVSDEPAILDEEGRFSVAGDFRYRAPGEGHSEPGRVSGFHSIGIGGESVTLTFGEGGATVDPLVVTLRRGERYEGLPLPCPA